MCSLHLSMTGYVWLSLISRFVLTKSLLRLATLFLSLEFSLVSDSFTKGYFSSWALLLGQTEELFCGRFLKRSVGLRSHLPYLFKEVLGSLPRPYFYLLGAALFPGCLFLYLGAALQICLLFFIFKGFLCSLAS